MIKRHAESESSTLSVVVVAKNSELLIKECLEAIRLSNPFEVIVVDGVSIDKTVDLARPLADKVISDEGKGLSYARQIGMEAAKGDYVAYVGPDNIIPKGCLQSLVAELQELGYAGIQAQMRVLLDERSTYWDRCWNDYFQFTHLPGEHIAIGTPSIFARKLLQEFGFDLQIVSADDTDLCLRLRQQGYRVGVGTSMAYEKQRLSFWEFCRRWRWYGLGDARFVYKHRRNNPSVALRHLFHPLRTYILGLSWRAVRRGKPTYAPFYVLCGLFRYIGLLQEMPRLLLFGTPQPQDQV